MGFEFVTENDPGTFKDSLVGAFKKIEDLGGSINSVQFSTAAVPIAQDYVVQYSAVVLWEK